MTPGSRALSFSAREAGLSYRGAHAVNRVDLDIAPGEILAVIGPSGAGKTSLLAMLSAGIAPTSGSIHVNGRDLASLSSSELRRLRCKLGHVPQQFGLVPNMRVLQNVLCGRLGRQGVLASLKSMARPSAAELEEVHALLLRLGVGEKLYERVDSLSGGEQQRVAVARALYQDPGALLADEPLSSLDPARARETLELLIELARERELTLVLSLHDLDLAREYMPRLIALRGGAVAFDCPASEVAAKELNDLYRLERIHS